MQTVKWLFRPSLAATAATGLVLPLLLSLGFWQLDRADEKQALFDEYSARVAGDAINLDTAAGTNVPLEDILWRKASVSGRYVDAGIFLLDNQVLAGTVGYHVYTVFVSAGSETLIMINRGWVAAGNYREDVPDIPVNEGKLTLSGIITGYPSVPGVQLGAEMPATEQMAPHVYRTQLLNQQLMQKLLRQPVSAYVLRLDPASPGGLVRVWPQPGSGKERHLGYAFQWFSLAVALVTIYIAVNLKRRKLE